MNKKLTKSNAIKDDSILLNEYSIIKTELGNLFQKNGILSATSVFVIGIIIEICNLIVSSIGNEMFWLISIIAIFPIVSLVLSITALFPNLSSTKTKYFKDFAECEVDEYDKVIDMINKNNVAGQIVMNSKIIMRKYKYYKWSLILLLPPLSLIPFIVLSCKNKKGK